MCFVLICANSEVRAQPQKSADAAESANVATAIPSQNLSRRQDWKQFRTLLDEDRLEDAVALLKDKVTSTREDERGLAMFAQGVLSYRLGRDEPAQAHLREAIVSIPRLEDYSRFVLAQSLQRSGKNDEARVEYEKSMASGYRGAILHETRGALAELAIQSKRWNEAEMHLVFLEKKARNSPSYPKFVYDLLRVLLEKKKRSQACRFARMLYTKYPGSQPVLSWGLDLQKAQVEGLTVGCVASLEDQKKRIRNLQYSGQSDRARAEIEIMATRAGAETKIHYEMTLANFLIEEGQVQEAFKLLGPSYERQKSNVSYLMLLGKAAARAGEYAAAVGAYDRAHQLAGRSKLKRDALFMAAFLAYQTHDFDGATRRFQDLAKRFGAQGLGRDANWYLGWIHYLKGEFSSACSSFAKVNPDSTRSTMRKGRRRARERAPGGFSAERIVYWLAMCRMKAGEIETARRSFEQIARDRNYGYYSLAARARLDQLKAPILERSKATRSRPEVAAENQLVSPFDLLKLSEIPNGSGLELSPSSSENKANPLATSGSGELEREQDTKPEDLESDDGEGESPDAFASAEDGATDEAEDSPDAGEVEPNTPSGDLVDPELWAKLKGPRSGDLMKRATDLVALGFHEWARFELSEIEIRARDRETQRMLMFEHEENHSYGRSSYIAEVNFGAQRVSQGLSAGRYLWEFAYPRAFEPHVLISSKEFGVPSELIWAIMRAESRYRPEARSQVGAIGLMQMMPYTGAQVAKILSLSQFSPEELLQPAVSIRFGARYLKRLSAQLSGKLPLIAAAYNAGPHRAVGWVKAWGKLDTDEFIEQIPYLQTRQYVKKVTHNFYIYAALARNTATPDAKSVSWLANSVAVDFEGPVPTRESWDGP